MKSKSNFASKSLIDFLYSRIDFALFSKEWWFSTAAAPIYSKFIRNIADTFELFKLIQCMYSSQLPVIINSVPLLVCFLQKDEISVVTACVRSELMKHDILQKRALKIFLLTLNRFSYLIISQGTYQVRQLTVNGESFRIFSRGAQKNWIFVGKFSHFIMFQLNLTFS